MKSLLKQELIDFMQKNKIFFGAVGLILVTTLMFFISIPGLKKEIRINADKKIVKVKSMKSTVLEVLQENKIKYKDEDLIFPEKNSRTFDGMTIAIKRAVPVVIHIDKRKLITCTARNKVKDLLTQEGIILNKRDRITPSINTRIIEGMKIKITRITIKDVTLIEKIPFKVIRQRVSSLPLGRVKVLRKGSYGMRKIVNKVICEDGKVVKQQRVLTWIKKSPISTIIAVGILGRFTPSRGGTVYYTRRLSMKATSYTADFRCTGKNPGEHGFARTATGTRASRNPDGYSTVAVDPSVIPLGTKLYVENYGYAIAEDTGGAVRGNIIDLYFTPGTSEYRRWYTHRVDVYVVK